MKSPIVYVIGHRNPDTDSICSAIAYADLRQRQGDHRVRAARAGGLNRQTEFVLDTLQQDPPELLTDVFPRIRDVVGGKPATISGEAPLAEAIQLMRRRDIRMLPVVDVDDRPTGALILKRLPEHILLPGEGRQIRQVLTSPASIQSCLKAEASHMRDPERVELLDLFIGAMAAQTFSRILREADPQTAVVLTGDRHKVQKIALEMGVRLLIVTGGLPVSEEICREARQRGVCVLNSPFDTATSALLTRLSTPVKFLADTDIPRVSPDDKLEQLSSALSGGGAPGAVVLDSDGRICGVATKTNLLSPSAVKLILVDHNELSQAVPGASQVEILEVIDHHRLGNFHTEKPIRFINQPVGSTCSLVATLFRQAGLEPAKKIAGLMLAGLLSDTVLLKSPTTTKTDRELVDWLSGLADLDPADFGRRMFLSGSALGEYASPQALLLSDFKQYEAGRHTFGIGQVEVVSFGEFHDRLDELTRGLAELCQERQLDFAGLLVSDIVEQTSQLLVQGQVTLIDAIGYPRLDTNLFELKGVLSRKKQLVPHLLRAFREVQSGP